MFCGNPHSINFPSPQHLWVSARTKISAVTLLTQCNRTVCFSTVYRGGESGCVWGWRCVCVCSLFNGCFVGPASIKVARTFQSPCTGPSLSFIYPSSPETLYPSSTIIPSSTTDHGRQRIIWDEPIKFDTKAKVGCSMVVSGQNNFTKLRVTCKNKGKSYWCDFLGKPNLCRAYNKNPRHYFTQIMWEMRKLQNACQGPRVYKPTMCKNAIDEVQMVFHSSWPKVSISQTDQQHQQQAVPVATTKPEQKPQAAKPVKLQPSRPVAKPGQPNPPAQPKKSIAKPKSTTVRPTTPSETQSTKLAEEYCWKSFQGVCAYLISWFQN
uniref:Fibroblast growth factor binding protein 2 n=1 Tax=Denticeps clupeoides TaxID=299321 RepID=A0AAY4A5P5_9TELE